MTTSTDMPLSLLTIDELVKTTRNLQHILSGSLRPEMRSKLTDRRDAHIAEINTRTRLTTKPADYR